MASALSWGAVHADEADDALESEASDGETVLEEELAESGDEQEAASESGDDADTRIGSDEHVQMLRAPVLNVCSALGGYEHVKNERGKLEQVYRLGDDCLGVWRADLVIWP